MSAISENIPKHLLKTVADDESTKTILIEQNSAVKKADKKKKEVKPMCHAAAKHNTIKDALIALTEKNMEVFVIREAREDDASKIKDTAYSRCTISAMKGNNFCHHHVDCKTLKIFDDDIIPRGDDDLERRQITSKDDKFFEDMGKRGARAKKAKTGYEFKDPNNPVKLVLEHKNGFLQIELNKFAFELLKNEKYKGTSTVIEKKSNRGRPRKNEDSVAAEVVNNTTNEVEDEVEDDESDEDEENVENNNSKPDFGSDEEVEKQNNEDEDDEDDDNEDEVELTTLCGKNITYVVSDNDIYDPEEVDDSGAATCIGQLFEIENKSYVNVVYNNKNYAILVPMKCDVDGKPLDFFRCPLNDNAFDMKMNFIGRYIEKNGKFEIEFTKKKVVNVSGKKTSGK